MLFVGLGSPDCHLGSAESVFPERGVLHVVAFVAVSQFLHKSLPQHAFTLAMDKDNFLTYVLQIFIHNPTETLDL